MNRSTRSQIRLTLSVLIVLITNLVGMPALGDEEASNVAHVVAGPYGRCYAKSVPAHVYDPDERQQGRTMVYRVTKTEDILLSVYDWFSHRLFIRCRPADSAILVRDGPWNRGHEPSHEDLAIAFYKDGDLMKRYSTLDISGETVGPVANLLGLSNVAQSVSHYWVFKKGPEMKRANEVDPSASSAKWVVTATTVDGRKLVFDIETGWILVSSDD